MSNEGARLYLVTQPVREASTVLAPLRAALDAGDVACVLLRLAVRDEGAAKKVVRSFVEATARHDVALLIEGDAQLAARAGADGVHVRGIGAALEAALASLKPERIVGCGGLKLRDDAMTAGEADVDYVMFGEPAPDGWVPPLDDTLERVGWWADIFQVPCVGYATALDDVAPLAQAGADFVALDGKIWQDADDPAAVVRAAVTALAVLARTIP